MVLQNTWEWGRRFHNGIGVWLIARKVLVSAGDNSGSSRQCTMHAYNHSKSQYSGQELSLSSLSILQLGPEIIVITYY